MIDYKLVFMLLVAGAITCSSCRKQSEQTLPEGKDWQFIYTSDKAVSVGNLISVRGKFILNDKTLTFDDTWPKPTGVSKLVDKHGDAASMEFGWCWDSNATETTEIILQGLPYSMFTNTAGSKAKFIVINKKTGWKFEKIFDVEQTSTPNMFQEDTVANAPDPQK